MKMIIVLTIFVCISLLQTQGQKPQQAENKTTNQLADTTKKATHDDVVINMEMINSFRRCYDKIEVIDWASILSNASSDGLGAIYMAYRRMQKTDDVYNDTKTLVAETEKVKNEVSSDIPITNKNVEDKNTITVASVAVKQETTSSK